VQWRYFILSEKIPSSKLKHVTRLLLKYRSKNRVWDWDWLEVGKPANKKSANKFLLGCILDYQMRAETAWENAHRLTENILRDPPDLWDKIARFSESNWKSKWRQFGIHRFPMAHYRVWRIAREIVAQYDGDARKIWRNQTADAVLHRLDELRVGKQISRMVVGALNDTGQIRTRGDAKVDVNVRRVLGRILTGNNYTPAQDDKVTEITRKMMPNNPWLSDYPLYTIGKTVCFASRPHCHQCDLKSECTYFMTRR
jgi:endonuclease III